MVNLSKKSEEVSFDQDIDTERDQFPIEESNEINQSVDEIRKSTHQVKEYNFKKTELEFPQITKLNSFDLVLQLKSMPIITLFTNMLKR